MKKIILCFLVGTGALVAEELKMKDVEALVNEGKKDVVVIDKKELDKYIIKKKAAEDVVDTNVSTTVEAVELAVVKEPEVIKKEKIIVNGVESFKSSILVENDEHFEIEYDLDLFSALKITKYIFAEKMEKERYPKIKKILLREAQKYAAIDERTFLAACEEMSEATAREIIDGLRGLE